MSITKPLNTMYNSAICKPASMPNKGFYRHNRGFTLLEALIGFLILSVGLLGIASLQTVSLQAGKSAVYGSVAMMKVGEMFESMRVNPTALAAYDVAAAGTRNDCTGTNDCTPEQLADDDVFWWNENLTAGLPATTTEIDVIGPVTPSNMATVTVTVNWAERNQDAMDVDGVARSYTATANICVAIPC